MMVNKVFAQITAGFALSLFCFLILFATATEECYFNAAFFNATYINNYGGDERAENFVKDATKVASIVIRNGKEIHLRLTDSIALNKVLKEVWGIKDYTISPNFTTHIWLFSLHIGACKTKNGIIALIEGLDISYDRPDEEFLWLKIEGELYSPMSYYQYEQDGYYHAYTELYLTNDNVIQAKKLIEQKYDIKTTVTSQNITPKILRRYLVYGH